MEDTMTTE
jgi:hypothetical protein